MKTFFALLALLAALAPASSHASEQQQTFVISKKPVDITETLRVKRFDPDKGTLQKVTISSLWQIDSHSNEWDVDIELVCPGPDSDNQSFFEHRNETGPSLSWAIGINPNDVGFPSYIGEGTIDFQVSFTGVVLPEPATGSLKLTVTYSYTH